MIIDFVKGTYNFKPPTNFAGHAINDVLPYYLLGNDPNDPTSGGTKFWVTLKAVVLKRLGR